MLGMFSILVVLLFLSLVATLYLSRWADQDGSIGAVLMVIVYLVMCVGCFYFLFRVWGMVS